MKEKDVFPDVENCYEEKIPHRTNIFSKNRIICPICGSEKIKKLKKLKKFPQRFQPKEICMKKFHCTNCGFEW